LKRVDLLRHLELHDREINDFLARKICRDLEVAEP
jgi:hypothetical protein